MKKLNILEAAMKVMTAIMLDIQNEMVKPVAIKHDPEVPRRKMMTQVSN